MAKSYKKASIASERPLAFMRISCRERALNRGDVVYRQAPRVRNTVGEVRPLVSPLDMLKNKSVVADWERHCAKNAARE